MSAEAYRDFIDIADNTLPHVPQGVAQSTFIIAETTPRELRSAVSWIFYDYNHAIARTEPGSPEAKIAETMEIIHEHKVRTDASFTERRQARIRMEEALADQVQPQMQLELLEPYMGLARQVDGQRSRLSRRTRIAASLAGGLAFASIITGPITVEVHQHNQELVQQNNTLPAEQQISGLNEDMTTKQKLGLIGIGTFFGSFGSIFGYGTNGFGLGGNAARRRAMKIVKQAEQK